MFHVPNKCRDRKHPVYASADDWGNNGRFFIPHYRIYGYQFVCMVSDGSGWEHVSVSVINDKQKQTRCPTWDEMCHIKSLFWDEQDTVIQYHPAKSEYVNMHPYVLHLWRPTEQSIPIPDKIMVGVNLK